MPFKSDFILISLSPIHGAIYYFIDLPTSNAPASMIQVISFVRALMINFCQVQLTVDS